MIIKNKKQLKRYKEVCDISTEILKQIKDYIATGKSTLDVDKYAEELCREYNVISAFQGVSVGNAPPYEHTTCISLNDTVVHGIPRENEKINSGDVVKVDFGIVKDGFYTDHCFTVGVEPISQEKKEFIINSRDAILAGVENTIAGNRIGDIGNAIESYVKEKNYSVAKEFVGHGIGKSLHEPPDVPAFGERGSGDILKKGLVICIEAQIINGSEEVYTCKDNWTVKTKERADACMFEYIVMADKREAKILTNTLDWSLFVN